MNHDGTAAAAHFLAYADRTTHAVIARCHFDVR